MQLVFATNNKHKIKEVIQLLNGTQLEILSLKDIGCTEELPETGSTIEQNAMQKARYVFDKYGYNCFADDTGLEIDALHGNPGVYSARYAGPQCNAADNIYKVLKELNHEENRKARFLTVIALIINGEKEYFKGEVKGTIAVSEKGNNGFGYDPVFIPDGFEMTYAEMSPEQKNEISHRGKAVKKLEEYLKSKY